jgi:hypothetical protein
MNELLLRINNMLSKEYLRTREPKSLDDQQKTKEFILSSLQGYTSFSSENNGDTVVLKSKDNKVKISISFDAEEDYCICTFGEANESPVYSTRVSSSADFKEIIKSFDVFCMFTWERTKPFGIDPNKYWSLTYSGSGSIEDIINQHADSYVRLKICEGLAVILNINPSPKISDFYLYLEPLGFYRVGGCTNYVDLIKKLVVFQSKTTWTKFKP